MEALHWWDVLMPPGYGLVADAASVADVCRDLPDADCARAATGCLILHPTGRLEECPRASISWAFWAELYCQVYRGRHRPVLIMSDDELN